MFFNKNNKNTTEIVDAIQNEVYVYIQPLGFKKHGRTFCRFVDFDIAQVINFQVGLASKGLNHCLWVNIGIRVPECVERTFDSNILCKKYYQEYECNIRCRLGELAENKDTIYDLRKKHKNYAGNIIKKLDLHVLPVFNTLNSRESILNRRKEYAYFDRMNNLNILLDESMIYGRLGNFETAVKLFLEYYKDAKCQENKHRDYILNNGKHIKDEWYKMPDGGIYSLPKSESGHVAYLQELAKKLSISL